MKRLIECATERHDNESRSKVQAILDSQGEHASVEVHKNCYCSFTSKDNIKKFVAKKRKGDSTDFDEACAPAASRIRRSQVTEFDFKKQCFVQKLLIVDILIGGTG